MCDSTAADMLYLLFTYFIIWLPNLACIFYGQA